MACSRMPKCTLRAPQPPAATSPPCLMATFVEVVRSADPATSSGRFAARTFSTLPDAARVAWASLCANSGRPSPQPPGRLPARRRSSSAASSGCALAVGSALPLPLGLEPGPPLPGAAPLRQRRLRHMKRLEAGPAQVLLGEPHLRLAERGAVGLRGVLLVRAAVGDVGAHDHERKST